MNRHRGGESYLKCSGQNLLVVALLAIMVFLNQTGH